MPILKRCIYHECNVKKLCANYMLEDGSEGSVLAEISVDQKKADCNWYWPTEGLIGTPDVLRQQTKTTKHHRRRGARWDI